jgi:hypothetical protein
MQTIDDYDYSATPKPPHGQGLGQYVGVEIEFLVDTYVDIVEVECALRDEFITDVKIDEDGSVSSDLYGEERDGLEACVLTTIDNLDKIDRVLKVLKQLNSRVNSTCGLHVHLDMRHVTTKQAKVIARRMAKALPALRSIVAPYRINSQYCSRNLSIKNDRYAAINTESLKKHGTIEVRLHQGTLDFTKIANWIKLLYAISRAAKVPRTANLEVLSKEVRLKKSTLNYFKKRQQLMKLLKQLEPSEVAREAA